MSEQAVEANPKRKKGRSPSYPGIDLETAIDRARQLWQRERQHPASVETIQQHWGYKGGTGPAAVTLAALKKFGLLQDEGSGADRMARLTDLAVDILENPDASVTMAGIKQAALAPGIHRELWEQYGAKPPSDANLRWELIRRRNFTESGASDFISEYQRTVAFAKLSGAVDVGEQGAEEAPAVEDDEDEGSYPPPPPQRREQQRRGSGISESTILTIPIPVIGGSAITIEGEFPVSQQAWDQFIGVLRAMQPGLVSARPPEPNDESTQDES